MPSNSSIGFAGILNPFFDKLFSGLISWNELWALIIITSLITFLMTLAFKFFSDQKKLKEIKDKQAAIRKEMQNHKDNPTKILELNKQLFSHIPETFKHQLKPLMITLIPIILMFTWMRITFSGIPLNFLGFINSWFWIYFIISLITSSFYRKILKVH